jgi:cytoskeletal protein RodZ
MKTLTRGNDKQDGWTSLETLVALFIVLLAFSALALAARQAILGTQRITDKVYETVQTRNETTQRVIELLNRR